jgi:hypothetical protein
MIKTKNIVKQERENTNIENDFKISKNTTLVHKVDIQTSPDKIWGFLLNIEKNYTIWHPEDHILFKWTDGKPFEKGSTFYAEQYMMKHKIKYKGVITESFPKSKITMKFLFPLSIITDRIEMIIEVHGSYSTFKHITYMKFKFLSRTLFKKRNIKTLQDMDAHVKSEGRNMKRILENQ